VVVVLGSIRKQQTELAQKNSRQAATFVDRLSRLFLFFSDHDGPAVGLGSTASLALEKQRCGAPSPSCT